jgi:hypothetical protein
MELKVTEGKKESECDGVEGDGKDERSQRAVEWKETERKKRVRVQLSYRRQKGRKEAECREGEGDGKEERKEGGGVGGGTEKSVLLQPLAREAGIV